MNHAADCQQTYCGEDIKDIVVPVNRILFL